MYGNKHFEQAKRLLAYYFERAGVEMTGDVQAEISGIVDEIALGVIETIKEGKGNDV